MDDVPLRLLSLHELEPGGERKGGKWREVLSREDGGERGER
jgi:hypothetical protein